MNRLRRFTSGIMAAAMLFGIAAPCASADETYIYIRTAADMKDLADRCMIDSYSTEKVVVLDCDIDLAGSEFSYIPYFSGTFEGCGHTISGFALEATNPERGFIGTIGATGIVKDLNVTGAIKEDNSTDSKANKSETRVLKIIDDINGGERSSIDRYFEDTGVYSVGGITGINKGTITNCSFNGSVEINKNAGGIAGVNEGRIETSANYAEVKCEENTGGIAGKNTGIIKWCNNYGRINDNAVEGMYATGGIVGLNEGVIEASNNYAEIGYKNTGSATGGIAGAQSGHIGECQNMGNVYGKKRVGGIAGNFEPYTNITYNADEIQEKIDDEKERIKADLDDLSNRFDTSRNKIKDDLDDFDNRLKNFFGISDITNSLSETADSLTNLNNTMAEKIGNGGSLASIANTLARAETDFSANNDEVRALLAETREAAKKMSDSTSNLSSSIVESNNHINDMMDSITDTMSDSERKEKINDTLDSVKSAVDSTSTAMDHLSTLKIPSLDIDVDILDDTDKQLSKSLKKINDNLDGLLDPFVKLSSAFSEAYNTLAERKKALQDIQKQLEDWLGQIGDTAPTIAPLPTSLPVIGFTGLFETTAYAADENRDKSTLKRLLDMDIHDIDIPLKRDICGETYEMAVVKYCVNSAEVAGYSDIGGISGGVGFGVSIGGSFGNINSDGKEFSLNPSTAIKSVISACINEGEVSAKNTSAGGITGFSDLGKIKDSINCGNIEVTDGSYCGGISGYSNTDIMRCINIGDVDAQSDIGGIGGYASNISETYALTRTSSSGERKGAIAGTVNDTVEHNYFLKEKLGGINGVDYSDKAQSVTKEVLAVDGEMSSELSGLESRYWTGTYGDLYMPQLKAFTENAAGSIPDLLKAKSASCALFRFTVDFRIDGESVKTLNIDYGENIPSGEIPKIPKVNGKYGQWDKNVKEPIIRNTKFNAVYDKSTSTLSYGGEPPQILVEGDFNPDAELVVEEFNPSAVINDSRYKPISGYALMVVQSNEKYEGDMKVHVRVAKGSKNIKIGLVTEHAVVIADCERDGSYVLFNPDGAERFIVLHRRPSLIPFLIIGLLLLAAFALIFLFRNRIKERRLLKKLKQLAERIHFPALPAKTETNESVITVDYEETEALEAGEPETDASEIMTEAEE